MCMAILLGRKCCNLGSFWRAASNQADQHNHGRSSQTSGLSYGVRHGVAIRRRWTPHTSSCEFLRACECMCCMFFWRVGREGRCQGSTPAHSRARFASAPHQCLAWNLWWGGHGLGHPLWYHGSADGSEQCWFSLLGSGSPRSHWQLCMHSCSRCLRFWWNLRIKVWRPLHLEILEVLLHTQQRTDYRLLLQGSWQGSLVGRVMLGGLAIWCDA